MTDTQPFMDEARNVPPHIMKAARELFASLGMWMQEAYEEADRLRQSDEELRSHEQEIYDTMVSRLRAAGRSTDVATNEAMIYPAFYRTMAERSGNTVEDLLRMFPLPEVTGARPEALQPKNSDEVIRQAVEKDQEGEGRKYGQRANVEPGFLAAENIITAYTRGDVTAAQARKQVQAMGWDIGPDGFRKKYDEIELIAPDGSSHRTYGQSGNLGLRGQIQFCEAGAPLISLFEKANLSTFLHESGHYFLVVTQALASQPGAPADIVEMYDTVKGWWRENAADVAKDAGNGVTAQDVITSLDNGTTGDAAKDAAVDVGMQEQFARASEAYFMEGKAPNQELRSAFEKFRAWLLNLYKRIVNLGVNVNDEIEPPIRTCGLAVVAAYCSNSLTADA